jgi:uncharacterized damage-inducible protein DinB
MTVDDVRTLYEYDAWANRRTLDSCAALTPEQFTRHIESSFSSVRDTLAHIYGAEWLWLERWHGRVPTALPSASDFPDLQTLRARWTEFQRELSAFIDALTPAELQRVIKYKNTRGTPFEGPLEPMLVHVVNHGTYHRGQVVTLLRHLGAKPVATDLIAFHRERAGQPVA